MAQYFVDLIVTDVCLILGQSFLGLIVTARCFSGRIRAMGWPIVLPVCGFKEWQQLAESGWSGFGKFGRGKLSPKGNGALYSALTEPKRWAVLMTQIDRGPMPRDQSAQIGPVRGWKRLP